MGSTIEYLAVTQSHNRANREAARVGAEAAREAYTAAYDWDDLTYDPEARERAITKAENAAEAAREHAFTQAWQPAFDRYLAEAYREYAQPGVAPPREGEATYGPGAGELTPNSERRFRWPATLTAPPDWRPRPGRKITRPR